VNRDAATLWSLIVKTFVLAAVLLLLPASAFAQNAAARTLDIYFIDVEGGQATLIVLPDGQTLLVDAGFPGSGAFDSGATDPSKARDPQRILKAARAAGVSRIDYLLVTHYHGDHAGGVPELAQLLPIGAFVDHGPVNDEAERVKGTLAVYRAYTAARARGRRRHIEAKAGDRLPMNGADVTIVSAAGAILGAPLAGARPGRNASCAGQGIPAGEPTQNPRSLGFVLQFGVFRFLDLGDLTGAPLFGLACPFDRIGPVDVYLVAHHGGADASETSLFKALEPRVAILNNGATKGGAAETFNTLRASKGTETWQLHRSENRSVQNFSDERIANLTEATSHWIMIRARADGSFAVTNGRTGATKEYPSR
jgi:beta-lactamase superfamily II metal-dependent hydrolase